MKIYKVILVIVGFFVLAKVVSFILHYYIHMTTPSIVEITENQARTSKAILSIIGEYEGFETHYNENDFNNSTANFSIKIVGSNKNALLKLEAKKNDSGQWSITKADTIYSD